MATTEFASGSTKKKYYDDDYFDTDEEVSDDEVSMAVDDSEKRDSCSIGENAMKDLSAHLLSQDRRKTREIQSNDDLLYDPEDDDANEDWVGEQLRGMVCKYLISIGILLLI
jgi:hypothetical protein